MTRNKAVQSYDKLLNEKAELESKYSNLQRQRDLKLDAINNDYGNKIDIVLREKQFLDMQIQQAKTYLKKN